MTKLILKNLFTAFFSLVILSAWSQPHTISVTGKVTDKETGDALEGITVYISNSTFTTQTSKDGHFSLLNIPFTNFEISFSAINYETQSQLIDDKNKNTPLLVIMQKNTALLNEVVITASVDKNGWAKYGSTFKKDFLSYSSFSQQCEIVNYQAIRFLKNTKNNSLKAYTKQPLKIINKALGYQIDYWLDEYEHLFKTQTMFYKGTAQFTELKGKKKQSEAWNKNRAKAYQGSLIHFLKSVYDRNCGSQGFIVNLIKTIPYEDLNLYIPKNIDTTTIYNEQALLQYIQKLNNRPDSLLLQKAKKWFTDSRNQMPFSFSQQLKDNSISTYFFIKKTVIDNKIFFFEFNVKKADAIKKIQWQTAGTVIPDDKALKLIMGNENNNSAYVQGQQPVKLFFSKPLDTEQFVTRSNANVYLSFGDTWQITYTKEAKDKEYINEKGLKNNDSGYQESTLTMTNTQPVIILPDGYYTNAYSLVTGAYWSYEKMDKMLPLDFKLSK